MSFRHREFIGTRNGGAHAIVEHRQRGRSQSRTDAAQAIIFCFQCLNIVGMNARGDVCPADRDCDHGIAQQGRRSGPELARRGAGASSDFLSGTDTILSVYGRPFSDAGSFPQSLGAVGQPGESGALVGIRAPIIIYKCYFSIRYVISLILTILCALRGNVAANTHFESRVQFNDANRCPRPP